MRRGLLSVVLLSSVCAVTPLDAARAQAVSSAPAIAYPPTKRVDLVDTQRPVGKFGLRSHSRKRFAETFRLQCISFFPSAI